MTILNFNNLMKVFQDTQEELKKFLQESPTNEIDDDVSSSEKPIELNEHEFEYDYSFNIFNENENKHNKLPTNNEVTVKDNICNGYLPIGDNKTEISTKAYSCDECGDVFLLKCGFSHHMWQKHNTCVSTNNFDQGCFNIKIKIPNDCSARAFKYVQKPPCVVKKCKFQCQICKIEFKDGAELKSHYNIHRTWKCDQCGAAFIKNAYLKDHMSMHAPVKKYVCDVCNKAFKYRNGLAVHKSVHVSDRAHICEACGQGFNARTTLLTHVRLKHGVNEKMYACSECDLEFKVKSWLDKHFQRKHTANRTKDFVCSICGMAYLNKYTLTRHINDKHYGKAKRHYCHICEKSYTMKNKLMLHMQKKHNILLGP